MSEGWSSGIGSPCAATDLAIGKAASLYGYCAGPGRGTVREVEARRLDAGGLETVSFLIATGRPQDPAYRIHREERVCVLFAPGDRRGPCVLVLREDFPDTPHQCSVPDGFPPCICVDDRPWIDARPTWSSRELVQRIRRWFERAGMDELHDVGQPMDPFFVGSQDQVIVPWLAFSAQGGSGEFVGVRKREGLPVVAVASEGGSYPEGAYPMHFHFCKASGARMARVRTFPRTLAGLVFELGALGIDLPRELGDRIKKWSSDDARRRTILAAKVVVVADIPTVDPASGELSGRDHYGFSIEDRIGDVGVALGLLMRTESGPSPDTFVPSLSLRRDADQDLLARIAVVPVRVYREFDPAFAAILSGRAPAADDAIVLIGTGAIGSMVAEPLVREGRSKWTLVDADVLLPHNLARHTLTNASVGDFKTVGLAARLHDISKGICCRTMEVDVLGPLAVANGLTEAAQTAAIVVDASASVPVGRFVSDLHGSSRRASIFFNPAGDDAVLLVEDRNRSVDLRSLEAAYYSALLERPDLAAHLTKSAHRIPYAGACREVTSRIPAWRVQALSGLVAGALSAAMDDGSSNVVVWRSDDDGSLRCLRIQVPSPSSYRVGGWTIMVPETLEATMMRLRAERLPSETGGVLLGVVDGTIKRIDVVAALPQPRGSVAGPHFFDRGITGLEDEVRAAVASTLDQVRYVGEWHSHPEGTTSDPSVKDVDQIGTFAEILDEDSCPMLMVIAHDGGIDVLLGQML